MYEELRKKFKEIISKNNLAESSIKITARTLSKKEALGDPFHDDYPLLKGKENLMEAEFRKSKGVAFSDMCGNFEGNLEYIANIHLKNNFYRAVFVSAVNAVLKDLGLIEKTEHCRDHGPVNCAEYLKDHFTEIHSDPNILLIGYQPRFAEVLTENFNTKIIDLNPENVGKSINGINILSEEETDNCIKWADLLFVTSSTFVNGTAEQFIVQEKEVIFYGVSGAGPTYLLGLNRYCHQ